MLVSLVSNIPLVGSFGLRLGLGGDLARSEVTSPSLEWELQLGEYDECIALSVEAPSAAEGRDFYATSYAYGGSSSLANSPSLQSDFLQSATSSAVLLCCHSSAHRGRRGGDILEGTMRGGKPRGGSTAHA